MSGKEHWTAGSAGGSAAQLASPRVVVGVSPSASGRAALRAAITEAVKRHAQLHLVRVWRDVDWLYSATEADLGALGDSERADGRALVTATEQSHLLAPDLDVNSELVPGDLFTQLPSRTVGADLLVLGAGEDPRGPGLVAEWFARHASCPVLIVDATEKPVRIDAFGEARAPAATYEPAIVP